MQTFTDRGSHMVSMDSYGCILDFPNWGRYYFFQVAPQLWKRKKDYMT
jgi:hypothetical protein